jgi:hypothetical protein
MAMPDVSDFYHMLDGTSICSEKTALLALM